MSKLIQTTSDVYEPYANIIAYKTGRNNHGESDYYLEYRKIARGVMGAGKPLTQRMLSSLLKKVQSSSGQLDLNIHGAIPQNVLYCDTRMENDKLIWWRGPEQRYMYFSDGLGIPNGLMWVPGLIYQVKGDGMMVYAFKGRKPTGVLYHAPFMNVSTYVCLGNAKVKKPEERTFVNVIAYWEKMFWQSEFSHILDDNPIKGNLATVTKRCIETGIPFPADVLKPFKNTTLKDLLK